MNRLKKILKCFVVIGFLGWAAVFTVQPGVAQEPTETNLLPLDAGSVSVQTVQSSTLTTTVPITSPGGSPAPTGAADTSNVITFDQLGFGERDLSGPFDSTYFRFRLPADWELTEGGLVQLNIITLFGGVGLQPANDTGQVSGGSLKVLFNDVTLGTVLLDQPGERMVTLPIPTTALTNLPPDDQHELIVSLDSALSCRFNMQTNVVILPTSGFTLPHQLGTPVPDLRYLPYPIYQDTFLPDRAIIIVPDRPTVEEMQAALAVAAGFGHMSRGQLDLSLKPVNRLTLSEQNAHHLMFVGKPKAFSLLKSVSFPASIDGENLKAAGAEPDDGVVQVIVSPWNESKLLLWIGGNSDAAVAKAGQAVSSGMIKANPQPDVALIAEVKFTDSTVKPVALDRTLADLGYAAEVRRGRGTNWIGYSFEVPPGYLVGYDAYLDLIVSHSGLLNIDLSGVTVTLNNKPVGSVLFRDGVTNKVNVKLSIPRFAVRNGRNELLLQTELEAYTDCAARDTEGLWLMIWPESSLHLPLQKLEHKTGPIYDLGDYPDPFALDVTLGNTAFVLDPADPTTWQIAAQLAFDLGNKTQTPLAEVAAVYGDDIPKEVREERHLLVVGKPSALPLISELGAALPAPFEKDSNFIADSPMPVIYRFPQDTSMGYLELIAAPWNADQVILAVLGSTDQGVRWAGAALTMPELRQKLAGNFALVNGDQIVTGRISPNPTGNNLTAAEPPVAENVEAMPANEARLPDSEVAAAAGADGVNLITARETSVPFSNQRDWLMPLLGASIVIMAVIMIIVIIVSRRDHHSVR